MQQPRLSSSPIFAFFGLLLLGQFLLKTVLSAHAELQTVLGQFNAASYNAMAQFELLSDFCLF
jgi:hypothetical protein